MAGTREPTQRGSGKAVQVFWLAAILGGVLLFLLYFVGYIVGLL